MRLTQSRREVLEKAVSALAQEMEVVVEVRGGASSVLARGEGSNPDGEEHLYSLRVGDLLVEVGVWGSPSQADRAAAVILPLLRLVMEGEAANLALRRASARNSFDGAVAEYVAATDSAQTPQEFWGATERFFTQGVRVTAPEEDVEVVLNREAAKDMLDLIPDPPGAVVLEHEDRFSHWLTGRHRSYLLIRIEVEPRAVILCGRAREVFTARDRDLFGQVLAAKVVARYTRWMNWRAKQMRDAVNATWPGPEAASLDPGEWCDPLAERLGALLEVSAATVRIHDRRSGELQRCGGWRPSGDPFREGPPAAAVWQALTSGTAVRQTQERSLHSMPSGGFPDERGRRERVARLAVPLVLPPDELSSGPPLAPLGVVQVVRRVPEGGFARLEDFEVDDENLLARAAERLARRIHRDRRVERRVQEQQARQRLLHLRTMAEPPPEELAAEVQRTLAASRTWIMAPSPGGPQVTAAASHASAPGEDPLLSPSLRLALFQRGGGEAPLWVVHGAWEFLCAAAGQGPSREMLVVGAQRVPGWPSEWAVFGPDDAQALKSFADFHTLLGEERRVIRETAGRILTLLPFPAAIGDERRGRLVFSAWNPLAGSLLEAPSGTLPQRWFSPPKVLEDALRAGLHQGGVVEVPLPGGVDGRAQVYRAEGHASFLALFFTVSAADAQNRTDDLLRAFIQAAELRRTGDDLASLLGTLPSFADHLFDLYSRCPGSSPLLRRFLVAPEGDSVRGRDPGPLVDLLGTWFPTGEEEEMALRLHAVGISAEELSATLRTLDKGAARSVISGLALAQRLRALLGRLHSLAGPPVEEPIVSSIRDVLDAVTSPTGRAQWDPAEPPLLLQVDAPAHRLEVVEVLAPPTALRQCLLLMLNFAAKQVRTLPSSGNIRLRVRAEEDRLAVTLTWPGGGGNDGLPLSAADPLWERLLTTVSEMGAELSTDQGGGRAQLALHLSLYASDTVDGVEIF